MINLRLENIFPFDEIPNRIASLTGGRRIHISTAHRWRLRGLKGVCLETILVGGTRYCSDEALARFFEKTTLAADKCKSESVRRGMLTAAREREIEAAESKLDDIGV